MSSSGETGFSVYVFQCGTRTEFVAVVQRALSLLFQGGHPCIPVETSPEPYVPKTGGIALEFGPKSTNAPGQTVAEA